MSLALFVIRVRYSLFVVRDFVVWLQLLSVVRSIGLKEIRSAAALAADYLTTARLLFLQLEWRYQLAVVVVAALLLFFVYLRVCSSVSVFVVVICLLISHCHSHLFRMCLCLSHTQRTYAFLGRRLLVYYIAFRVISAYQIVSHCFVSISFVFVPFAAVDCAHSYVLVLQTKLTIKYLKKTEPQADAMWAAMHEAYAPWVYKVSGCLSGTCVTSGLQHILSLQGFWIKIGQYLSSRADVMPPSW